MQFKKPREVNTDDCWLFAGYKNERGYGRVTVLLGSGKWATRAAHRLVYESVVGEIPSGYQLDHLCRVRCCVNPSHLEPVTLQENNAPGNTACSTALRDNRCKNGHEFTPENTWLRPRANNVFTRVCKACRRIKALHYYRLKVGTK